MPGCVITKMQERSWKICLIRDTGRGLQQMPNLMIGDLDDHWDKTSISLAFKRSFGYVDCEHDFAGFA